MRTPHTPERATEATARAAIISTSSDWRTSRQRLLLFSVREAVIARCFVRLRRNSTAIVPPRTVAVGRAR
jgi:hypothetical protein